MLIWKDSVCSRFTIDTDASGKTLPKQVCEQALCVMIRAPHNSNKLQIVCLEVHSENPRLLLSCEGDVVAEAPMEFKVSIDTFAAFSYLMREILNTFRDLRGSKATRAQSLSSVRLMMWRPLRTGFD